MKELYSRQELADKYPSMRGPIYRGDFRIMIDGQGVRYAQWPNTSICGPDFQFTIRVIFDHFKTGSLEDIKIRVYGIVGIEYVIPPSPHRSISSVTSAEGESDAARLIF